MSQENDSAMMTPSHRGTAMPASPIRFLEPVAHQTRQRGISILHLNIGQPDLETPGSVWLRLRSLKDKTLAYSPSTGYHWLRERLAAHYSTFGGALDPGQIVVTTGGSEAILYSFLAVCDPGDEILIPEPFYTNYAGYAHMAGCRVVPVETRIEDGFHLPSVEAVEAALTPKTRAMIVCNPGNPTGAVYRPDELSNIARLVRERGIFLIGDEVYRDFVYDGLRHHSVLALEELSQQTILIDSMSKRYSACGARIGALVTRNPEILSAVTRFAQARLSPPTMGQHAWHEALLLGPYYYQRVRELYLQRRNTVCAALEKIDGLFCRPPSGAFYLMARLPVPDASDFCRWMLAEFQRDSETVMLAPAAGFYATPGKGLDEVRIAYVLDTEPLDRAMRLLEEALRLYNQRSGTVKECPQPQE